MKIESQTPIIEELERCAAWAYKKFAGDRGGVPPVTVSIQSRGKKHTLCGVFRPNHWSTKEGEPVHEIVVTSEHLFEDPYDVLGTVVHETVHCFNHDRGEKDCSKGGRHNETFRETAQSFGLSVAEPVDSKGHAYTSLGDKLRGQIEKEFKPKLEVFRIFKEQEKIKPRKAPTRKVRPWVCACPVTVQVAVGVNLQAHCSECNSEFQLKEA